MNQTFTRIAIALLLIGLAGCAPATPLETANAVMAILLFVGGTAAVGAGLAWVLEKKQGWKFLPVVLLGALAVSMAIDFMVTHPEPGLPHHTTHSALEPVR